MPQYRINISQFGGHYLTTSHDHLTSEESAKALYKDLKKRFPKSEGFEIKVTRWETIGKQQNWK